MNGKLYVYADWVGLEKPAQIGALQYDRKGADEVYSFCFNNIWLSKHKDLFLSADLGNWSGWQYPAEKNVIPGMFADVMPDRWGRLLLRRREQLLAQKENRSARQLSSYDMLMLIHDKGRMGGLRFKTDPQGEFINNDAYLSTPPFTKLRDLEYWCDEFEEREDRKLPPEEKWLANLIVPSTGLGGARPKANILDEKGGLNIAKFPSHDDTEDKELWEHFAHLMARHCGINTAETRLLEGKKNHILLSRRFDRDEIGRRIHIASAMTLLGLKDGCNANTGNGYLDIVDFILQNTGNPEKDIRELYRRVAFNICIGNSDDHFRNHSFLLAEDGWTLSPAYDINPTNNRSQALLISKDSSMADLKTLMDASDDYMIDKEDAKSIIYDVQMKFRDWRKVARQLQIPNMEITTYEDRFDTMAKMDLNGQETPANRRIRR